MIKKIETDVIIVGKGIAGLTLSVLLKEKGIDFVLLDRRNDPKKNAFAETLPPSTLVLLETIGLLGLFKKSSSKTYGYHSLWGTSSLQTNNFFLHNPYKYGLKLNKEKLLVDLESMVSNHVISFDQLISVNTSEKSPKVIVKQSEESLSISGKVLIDATGRSRAVLKQLNIPVDVLDHQVAFTCHVPKIENSKLIHKVVVESFEQGWGIVSSLDDETNVMTLFSQKGNLRIKQFKEYMSWKNLLVDTSILKELLTESIAGKVIGSDANSSKASKMVGENWIALGDAGIAFDPLSSHGVSNALYCAKTAADTIENYLRNPLINNFNKYEKMLLNVFETYRKHQSGLYKSEQRWMESSFWRTKFDKIV